jgi:DNA-binding response OmpR family regulator
LNVRVTAALPALRDQVRKLLEGEGFCVRETQTVDGLIDRVRIEPPDLIVLYLGRTESPTRVIDKLHRQAGARSVPILVMGGSRKSRTDAAPASGATVVPVAFDPQLLIEHIWHTAATRARPEPAPEFSVIHPRTPGVLYATTGGTYVG